MHQIAHRSTEATLWWSNCQKEYEPKKETQENAQNKWDVMRPKWDMYKVSICFIRSSKYDKNLVQWTFSFKFHFSVCFFLFFRFHRLLYARRWMLIFIKFLFKKNPIWEPYDVSKECEFLVEKRNVIWSAKCERKWTRIVKMRHESINSILISFKLRQTLILTFHFIK